MLKIISYNVNGIRAASKKGLLQWMKQENADIVCLQEVKANREQVDLEEYEALGYDVYWHAALKKGYSGLATFTKKKPLQTQVGMGHCDEEGRVMRHDFEDFSLINVYIPSGTTGDVRQDFKMVWLQYFQQYVEKLKLEQPNLIICGDYNICHQPIDIHNPVSNKNSSGFLPEERVWLTEFITSGFIDTYRHFDPSPHRYTWWSYRAGARERNLGWRIDYLLASTPMKSRLRSTAILADVLHSDHCPVRLEIE
jgi:exodeoxyribonuclease-3